MPIYLRPTAPIAADAILVGDPGRALLLAQELLEQPKMSNHARGLWGYHGTAVSGRELTIQSTGIGGPSAALVLADLAELGVRTAVRVGTCVAVDHTSALGDLLLVEKAIAAGGSAVAFGARAGEAIMPDEVLTGRLRDALGAAARSATVASVDAHPEESSAPVGAVAIDMQTAPLLAQARELGLVAAATLIVLERSNENAPLEKETLETKERLAGRAALASVSP
ncbi:MAG TPA: hypothetical protein VG816_01240 [Solirubrobacterales bacterium]|nr:hypothetical protein [Solirubrobacterales bacterium]